MKVTFIEKKAEISDVLKEYAEKKVGKLDRYFRGDAQATVTFGIERGRHTAEITVHSDNTYFRASERTSDMYASIDSAIDSIVRQIHKNKTRLAKRLRQEAFDRSAYAPDAPPVEEEKEFVIVRTKHFAIKPMTPEEAILQMNLLNHKFYVFRNESENGAFAVVYKRDDGGYGLIEED
jgi:putative sigma-54 modulation protein